MRSVIYRLGIAVSTMALMLVIAPVAAIAEDNSSNANNEQKYYIGSVVNTGTDTGYSESHEIDSKDPHFGWDLGSFSISGYTTLANEDGTPVFLKNVGDTVTLWFNLQQDINQLNGNENLTISDDSNGYDQHFGIAKSDFGRGTLIITHTDYQNKTGDPEVYTDYLAANAVTSADTEVEFFEEGDYEVALDYEIENNPRKVPLVGWSIFPGYSNYQIRFSFKVRNGNCMVFPFDVTTGAELTNSAVTANGFYLDLAKSRYLDIYVKKEVLKEGADGLTEDVRFNKPAKDGDKYTEEGVYTITVSNRYTGQETTKKIYVGTNDILKAYAATGLSIDEIRKQLSNGATIADDGSIIDASGKVAASSQSKVGASDQNQVAEEATSTEETSAEAGSAIADQSDNANVENKTSGSGAIVVIVIAVAAACLAVFVIRSKKKHRAGGGHRSGIGGTRGDGK